MGHYVVLEGAALADASGEVLAVADRGAAVEAVLAAVRGADLVIAATAKRDVIDQLCDDLRRLGTVEHRVEARTVPTSPAAALSADERALLVALLGGASLGEAAAALHLSRRTADRRLAAARRALGASSTAEALVLAAQAGLSAD
jgi:DNA-binding NarL/FixJ family response regulator